MDLYDYILSHYNACVNIFGTIVKRSDSMFWDNLKIACSRNGTKVSPLLQDLGISTGNIGRWQKGGAISSEMLLRISERLDVSTDFLLTGKNPSSDPSEALTREEQDLLDMYRDLPAGVQQLCMNYIKASHDTYTAMQGENSAV